MAYKVREVGIKNKSKNFSFMFYVISLNKSEGNLSYIDVDARQPSASVDTTDFYSPSVAHIQAEYPLRQSEIPCQYIDAILT